MESKLLSRGMREGWPTNKKALYKRLDSSVKMLIENKSWFVKSFSTLPEVWKKAVKVKGNMTDEFVPKYT